MGFHNLKFVVLQDSYPTFQTDNLISGYKRYREFTRVHVGEGL